MTDYSKMSDFDITCEVAKGIYPDALVLDVKRDSTGSNCTLKFGPHGYKGFNPCNSWADAGPIIAKNKISLDFDADGYEPPQNAWCKTSTPCGQVYYGGESEPLRAAMIVFLMMKEPENDS